MASFASVRAIVSRPPSGEVSSCKRDGQSRKDNKEKYYEKEKHSDTQNTEKHLVNISTLSALVVRKRREYYEHATTTSKNRTVYPVKR